MLAARLVERNFLVYRHAWLPFLTGFLEPVLYLFSIGVGLGALVGRIDGVDYASYVAPAMLATSAMNGAVIDATFGVYFKLRWVKLYDAMLSTPMRPSDIAAGEIAWSLGRGAFYGAAFLAVMTAAGYVRSPWAVLALPAATLIGLAFASVAMAATTWMTSWHDFDLIALATVPLFLFSATFYPLSTYAGPVRGLVACTPLYHGVALVRGLTLGDLSLAMLGHVAYLTVMAALGFTVASRRLAALLLK
jgi:lipooligosaccharide transport system permease protein